MNHSVITLRGPTASGKTNLAITLSDKLPLEIISVDSVMVYRGLNIGSAKPDKKTLDNYPHHLIDICDPNVNYSLGSFYEDANQTIRVILKKGAFPQNVWTSGLEYWSGLQLDQVAYPVHLYYQIQKFAGEDARCDKDECRGYHYGS